MRPLWPNVGPAAGRVRWGDLWSCGSMRPYAAMCGHMRPHMRLSMCIHMRPCVAECQPCCGHSLLMHPYASKYGHMRPYAAKGRPCCRHSDLGDLWCCGSVRSCATICSHMQPFTAIYATICRHMPPHAAICVHMRPYVAACGHMQPNVGPAAGTVSW